MHWQDSGCQLIQLPSPLFGRFFGLSPLDSSLLFPILLFSCLYICHVIEGAFIYWSFGGRLQAVGIAVLRCQAELLWTYLP